MNPTPGRIPRWPREFDQAGAREILTRNSASDAHPIHASTFPPRGETTGAPFPKTMRAIFLDPAAAAGPLIPEENPVSDHFFPWAESQKLLLQRQICRECA